MTPLLASETSKGRAAHRHDRSMWIMCGGFLGWCYTCGAVRRLNKDGGWHDKRWTVPSGDPADNPACRPVPRPAR